MDSTALSVLAGWSPTREDASCFAAILNEAGRIGFSFMLRVSSDEALMEIWRLCNPLQGLECNAGSSMFQWHKLKFFKKFAFLLI